MGASRLSDENAFNTIKTLSHLINSLSFFSPHDRSERTRRDAFHMSTFNKESQPSSPFVEWKIQTIPIYGLN